MDINEILGRVDHTLLAVDATWEDIRKICQEGINYKTASVCIPPFFVKQAREFMDKAYEAKELELIAHADGEGDWEHRTGICTVIGFPNGYSTSAVKEAETRDALKCGADEIDMVIHIGDVKEGRFSSIEEEIKRLKEACEEHILKVIVETCLLTEEEKIKMCEVVTRAGADYIKTSTGFSTGGATPADIALFKKWVGPDVKIKAAGGIATFADAEKFIELGADRLGTSRIVKLSGESGFLTKN